MMTGVVGAVAETGLPPLGPKTYGGKAGLFMEIPSLVPTVAIGTENVVIHALPNLSEEKRRRKKEEEKRGSLLFFSGQVRQCMGDHILCAYYHVGHQ